MTPIEKLSTAFLLDQSLCFALLVAGGRATAAHQGSDRAVTLSSIIVQTFCAKVPLWCSAFARGLIVSSSEVRFWVSCFEVRRTSSVDIPEMDLYAECTQFLEVAALEMTARGLTRAKFLRSAGQSRKIACGIRSA